MPYIIVSLFAGTFVDNHSKKKVMLASAVAVGKIVPKEKLAQVSGMTSE